MNEKYPKFDQMELCENGLDLMGEVPFDVHDHSTAKNYDKHRKIVAEIEEIFHVSINLYSVDTSFDLSTLPNRKKYRNQNLFLLTPLFLSCKHHSEENIPTMHILLDPETAHSYYIKDIDKTVSFYECPDCSGIFTSLRHLQQHRKTINCSGGVKYIYKGGFYSSPKTVFEDLEQCQVFVLQEDQFNPHIATFDIESYAMELETEMKTTKTEILSEQKMVSFSVCSNVPGFDEPYHEVNIEDPEKLVDLMHTHLQQIRKKAAEIHHEKMDQYYAEIQEQIIDLGGIPFIHPEQTILPRNFEKLQENKCSRIDVENIFKNFFDNNDQVEQDEQDNQESDSKMDEEEAAMAQIREIVKAVVQQTPTNEKDEKKFEQRKKHQPNKYYYNEDDQEKRAERIQQMKSSLSEVNADVPEEETDLFDDASDDEENDEPKKKPYAVNQIEARIKQLQKLQNRLRDYGRKLSVVGFNSGKYDLNVMIKYWPKIMKMFTSAKPPEEKEKEDSPDDVDMIFMDNIANDEVEEGEVLHHQNQPLSGAMS